MQILEMPSASEPIANYPDETYFVKENILQPGPSMNCTCIFFNRNWNWEGIRWMMKINAQMQIVLWINSKKNAWHIAGTTLK